MESPQHRHTVKDEAKNITYDVLSYRALSPEEARQMVVVYLRGTPKRKRPKKNSRLQVFTSIGARD